MGMMLVPQGIAYASGIALLPPQYGLYASFVGLLVYAVLGTSKDLSVRLLVAMAHSRAAGGPDVDPGAAGCE